MNPYVVVKEFEKQLSEYTGAPYVVCVDSSTNALFLCCYRLEVDIVTIPKHTYLSVPMSIVHAGGEVEFGDLEMRNLIGLLLLGLFLSGCYTNSLVYVGPATGVLQGRTAESLISTSVNYAVKKQTGKNPIEYVLTKQQVATYESKKRKLKELGKLTL